MAEVDLATEISPLLASNVESGYQTSLVKDAFETAALRQDEGDRESIYPGQATIVDGC